MTLTIEQVQNCKFHLARRNGYEPVDVDNFVDKVEETLAQLHEENETLKRQVEAIRLRSAGDDSGESEEGASERSEPDPAQTEDLRRQLAERDAEVERLRAELEQAPGDATSGEGRVERVVVTAASDAAPAVTRLLQMATEQADTLVAEARAEASRIVSDAEQNKARLEGEASENANRVTTDAQSRAEALDREVVTRRDELFGTLEEERSALTRRVEALRAFESDFRERFASQLQAHIDNLRSGAIEPEQEPELLDADQPASRTPRLDALLERENG